MLEDTNSHLAQPHVHQRVPCLANLPHVQLPCARCHQSRRHSTWVWSVQPPGIGCVKTSKLLEREGVRRGVPQDLAAVQPDCRSTRPAPPRAPHTVRL